MHASVFKNWVAIGLIVQKVLSVGKGFFDFSQIFSLLENSNSIRFTGFLATMQIHNGKRHSAFVTQPLFTCY